MGRKGRRMGGGEGTGERGRGRGAQGGRRVAIGADSRVLRLQGGGRAYRREKERGGRVRLICNKRKRIGDQ